jgi:hypothetical protein
MYGLYGICNHDPATVFKLLTACSDEQGLDMETYTPKLLPHTPWTSPISGIVGVPSVALFQQRFEHLVKAKAVIILFDSAPLLEYIKDLPIFDLATKHVSYQYRFKDLDSDSVLKQLVHSYKAKQHIDITTQDLELIPTLLNQTQSSLLSPMLTYLYAIPLADRSQARSLFYKWLTLDKTVDDLMARLPGNKQASNLRNWLDSETGVSTHQAVRTLWQLKQQAKPVNTAKIAKQFNLAEYDLTYLLIAINKEQLTKVTPLGKTLETIHSEE